MATLTNKEKLENYEKVVKETKTLATALEAALQNKLYYHGSILFEYPGNRASVAKIYQVFGTHIMVESIIGDNGSEYYAGLMPQASLEKVFECQPAMNEAVEMVATRNCALESW